MVLVASVAILGASGGRRYKAYVVIEFVRLLFMSTNLAHFFKAFSAGLF
jgi:hypothetical protein